MKWMRGLIAAFALASFVSIVTPPAHADVNVSFNLFYSDLSPHGSWLVSAEYGRVWQPRVYARGWNPYYDGHWEYTDLGWTWVSDYAWGAIPYHYGTWAFDPLVGWVWVPGTTWAPAWVVFRTGPDYIGWAPVAPSFTLGVSFGGSAPIAGDFVFVSTRDFCAPKIRGYVVPERDAQPILGRTTVVNNLVVQNNIVVNRGPDVRVVEQASHRKIAVREVEGLPRVAPFASVHRDQLTIAPERARQTVHAAEPVSADRPMPSKETAQLSREEARAKPQEAQAPTPRAAPDKSAKPPASAKSPAPAKPAKTSPAKKDVKPQKSEKPQKKHDEQHDPS